MYFLGMLLVNHTSVTDSDSHIYISNYGIYNYIIGHHIYWNGWNSWIYFIPLLYLNNIMKSIDQKQY